MNYRVAKIFAALNFHEFYEKIPIHENIIVNMLQLFPYISTVITYLFHEKLNAKILFWSFLQKFSATKISDYTVPLLELLLPSV